MTIHFDKIRAYLYDPTLSEERKSGARACAIAQVASLILIIPAIKNIALSILSFPAIGLGGLALYCGVGLLGREIYVLSKNLGNIINGQGMIKDAMTAMNRSQFLKALLKDTWLICEFKPFIASLIN